MKSIKMSTCRAPLSGTLTFPGDKSLSHRAVIFGALAEGRSHFTNVLAGEDCLCTRKAFEAMGVKIASSKDGTDLTIDGAGLHGLKQPKHDLYLGNSGTSMRLLMGVLAGQMFSATLTGDTSLSNRPMKRVADPLRRMGANIEGKENGNFAPITVRGGKLRGINYELPVASAQVKSAVLLAGLYAKGVTSVTEPIKSRDHTERFLKYFGANIEEKGNTVSVHGEQALNAEGFEIGIPGDISSAAFFMVLAALVQKSRISFKNVLFNPTRSGILDVFRHTGIGYHHTQSVMEPEETIDFSVEAHPFTGFEIKKEELPALIDEIPILCVLATQAKGRSVIHDADELRVKETDRINSMVTQLSKMGAKISAEGNSIIVEGPTKLQGTVVHSFKDHRTAMSLVVAGLVAEGQTVVEDIECINTSFPGFFERLKTLKIPFSLCD